MARLPLLRPAPPGRDEQAAWCARFAVDGEVPRVARELLAAVQGTDDTAVVEAAGALGVLRAHSGSSTGALLEDVLALRPLLEDRARRDAAPAGVLDADLLVLSLARAASVLDAVLRAALDAHVEESSAVLRARATRDALTGLVNRAAFEEALQREVAAAERGRAPALLLVDLDGFKGVNDTLGHLAGDDVLVRVSRLLERGVRRSDVVARLGGDEFAVLLPATTPQTAVKLATRLLSLVDADDALQDERAPVGLSVGVARLRAPRTGAELVAAADEAMYEAKRGGGSRLAVRQDAA